MTDTEFKRPTFAPLRGGPNDGETVEVLGFQHEIPAPPGSQYQFHVYSWQQDEDGFLYGRWEAEANV